MSIEKWRGAAEEVLSAAWGDPVSCTDTQVLRDKGRNRVYRPAVAGGAAPSVVLKGCVSDNSGNPYVAGDPALDGAFARLCNEWAGARLLGRWGSDPTPTAAIRRGAFVSWKTWATASPWPAS